jgi:hypothetical protein
MKPGRREGHHTGTRERGRAPGRNWEIDKTLRKETGEYTKRWEDFLCSWIGRITL